MSDQSYDGILSKAKEYSFFSSSLGKEYNTNVERSLGGIQVRMSMDIVNHSRSIYTVLNLLGDIGGLYSLLRRIGSSLLSFFTFMYGSKLHSRIIKKLFKTESKTITDDNEMTILESIFKREKAKTAKRFWCCVWC